MMHFATNLVALCMSLVVVYTVILSTLALLGVIRALLKGHAVKQVQGGLKPTIEFFPVVEVSTATQQSTPIRHRRMITPRMCRRHTGR
jgi:hypothetical protein